MYRKGHVGISMMFAASVMLLAPIRIALLITGIVAITERLPDKDQIAPKIDHRGFSHTIWAGGIIATLSAGGVLAWVIAVGGDVSSTLPSIFGVATTIKTPIQLAAIVWIGVVLGFVSHITGDMITVGTGGKGVQPLKPLVEWELPIGVCRASSNKWNKWLFISGQTIFLLILIQQSLV